MTSFNNLKVLIESLKRFLQTKHIKNIFFFANYCYLVFEIKFFFKFTNKKLFTKLPETLKNNFNIAINRNKVKHVRFFMSRNSSNRIKPLEKNQINNIV